MKNDTKPFYIGKIISYSIILFLICFNFINCDKAVNPEDDQHSTKNLVAFTAVFNDTYISGRNYQKLVIADFYDPTNYTILTDTNIVALEAFFSKDKSEIIFGDDSQPSISPQLAPYNLSTNIYKFLGKQYFDYPLSGKEVVWNQDGTGFYFAPLYWGVQVLFYSFSEKSVTTIRDSASSVALIDRDTLIVHSSTEETNKPLAFYLMDVTGNLINRLNNPYLECIYN